MALGIELLEVQLVAFLHGGQQNFLLSQFGIGVIAAFHIRSQETFKLDGCPRGLKDRAVRFDRDCDAFLLGIRHLASDSAFPDHIEQSELIVIQFASQCLRQLKRMPGRTNGFVGFLRILYLAGVNAWRWMQKRIAVLLLYQVARAAWTASVASEVESVRM